MDRVADLDVRNEPRPDAGAPDLGRKLVWWFVLVGAVSAVSYAGRFTGGKPPKNALYLYSTAASELILFAIILAFVFLIARGLPRRETFALRRPDSWGRAFRLDHCPWHSSGI